MKLYYLYLFLRIYPVQAGINPPVTERSEFTEWETDALANQATTAGFCALFGCHFYVTDGCMDGWM